MVCITGTALGEGEGVVCIAGTALGRVKGVVCIAGTALGEGEGGGVYSWYSTGGG